MPQIETMADSAENTTPRRRSTRILLRVPLIINVVSASEEPTWEPVATVTVSQHGGMVRAREAYSVGDTIEIRVRDKDRIARARVAWTSSQLTPQGFELGFEILDEDGFWEINFPPDRWSERKKQQGEQP